MRVAWKLALLAVAAIGPLPRASAQQPAGVITGQVREVGGAPVVDANVVIVGTTRGARTAESGRYRIAGVPAGTYQVRIARIGFNSVTRTVTVTAGAEVAADFQLQPAAVMIDQVLVTATGASERKRENGNDVGIIKPGNDVSLAAQPTLTSVLTGRTAGLSITQNMGTAGTSSRIRIRGANSVSLSNEPLLIIDGVRASNNAFATSLGVGGASTSRFDDINPEDVESIEVLKGPAASALYGTAAANGVIQVTTKRGRTGKTQWRSFAQAGTLTDVTPWKDNYYVKGLAGTTGTTTYSSSCILDRATRGLCRADTVYTFNPATFYKPYDRGSTMELGLSAAGGGDVAQYYIGANGTRTQGVSEPNKLGLLNLRSNITAQLRQNLNATVTANYIDRTTRLPYNDNNIYGAVPNAVLGRAFNCAPGNAIAQCRGDTISHGFYAADPRVFFYMTNQQLTKRFIGGGTVTWQALPWLTAVGQGGADVDNSLDEVLQPANVVTFINQSLIDGSRRQRRNQNMNYSANGSLTATRTLPWNLQSQTSIGTQYINEQQHWTEGQGRQLVPGTGSLGTVGAGKDVGESNQTIVTIGGYAREQLAWRDRLFVTGAVRADENSAFGKNFSLAYYPSASVSWVMSEEGFMRDLPFIANGWMDQLRLRASYGQSGQRPGFRQADTYLSGVSVADKGSAELTAVVIGGTGNADLKPEISTEYEGGFDASFFGNRVGLGFTHFSKTTRDALIAQTLAPSLGVSNSRFVNIGKVFNGGNELTVNATAVDMPRARLDLMLAFSTLKNRLESLGEGIPPIIFNGGYQRFQEGYPLGGFFQRPYTYTDINKDGIISRANCPGVPATPGLGECELTLGDTSSAANYIGSVLPTRELSFTPTLTLFGNLRLSALVQHRGGNYVYNNTEEFRCSSSAFLNCQGISDPKAPLWEQARALAKFQGTGAGYVEKGDYTKLRELSATLSIPRSIAMKARVAGLSLTVAGRNLKTWTDYTGFDPELNASTGSFTQFDFLSQPPLKTWTARLDVTF